MTPYMQGLICRLGQHAVFEEASGLLESILNIDLSPKQIQRVSEWYGGQINPIVEANQTDYIPQLPEQKAQEPTYVMLDGSMIYTREEEWKEMKLARIFREHQVVDIQTNRREITGSVYVGHLGSVHKFCPKVERHLSCVRSPKVFVADGAKWIWNWVEDNYPGSTQILDYYHAVEKIEAVARLHYTDEGSRRQWLHKQKELLLDNQVLGVIDNLQALKTRKQEVKESIETATRYYLEHEDRMMYRTYKAQGLLIGSGPIEAAHRNVIQQRLKLSGQKWSVAGAQAIANLRCYNQSRAWHIIENLIRIAA